MRRIEHSRIAIDHRVLQIESRGDLSIFHPVYTRMFDRLATVFIAVGDLRIHQRITLAKESLVDLYVLDRFARVHQPVHHGDVLVRRVHFQLRAATRKGERSDEEEQAFVLFHDVHERPKIAEAAAQRSPLLVPPERSPIGLHRCPPAAPDRRP